MYTITNSLPLIMPIRPITPTIHTSLEGKNDEKGSRYTPKKIDTKPFHEILQEVINRK